MKKTIYTAIIAALVAINPAMAMEDLTHTCSVSGNVIDCDLVVGDYQYTMSGPDDYLVLKNNTATNLQIDYVWMIPPNPNDWAEYCVYLDSFQTSQEVAGVGEVGCIHKEEADCGYGVVRWDRTTTSLSVLPGSTVYIQGTSDYNMVIGILRVGVKPQTSGVLSYRQPKIDQTMTCNGQPQSTAWSPWQNTTGARLVIGGATIYAVDRSNETPMVGDGCLYILDVNYNVRWSYCAGVNVRGTVDFPDQIVEPGEWIAGQALNSCAPGPLNAWGWAAYIYVWNY